MPVLAMDKATVTRLLQFAASGEAAAAEELVPLIYDELHRIAERVLRSQQTPPTLQATELIHEAYLRLADDGAKSWDGRIHFQRVAARAMRCLLVDRARARDADKLRGGRKQVTLDEHLVASAAGSFDQVVEVHEGLERLAAVDPQAAEVVELRAFGGLTVEETATALDVSPRTVKRDFRFARAWWLAEMRDDVAG